MSIYSVSNDFNPRLLHLKQISISEEDGLLLESTASKNNGITYVADMEPFYTALYGIISKYLITPITQPILVLPNGFVGLPGECFCRDTPDGDSYAWDGERVPAFQVADNKKIVQWSAPHSNQPAEIKHIPNRLVFNLLAHVLESHFLKASCNWAGPNEYDTIWNYYHAYVNKDNIRINAEQQQFLANAAISSQQRAATAVENEIRSNFLKQIPMSETDCVNRITSLQSVYYQEAIQSVLNDQDTSTRMMEMYDDLILWARKNLPNYFQLNKVIESNPWGVFDFTIAARTGRNNNLVVYYHGDFRILQWESEHLSKYPSKHE